MPEESSEAPRAGIADGCGVLWGAVWVLGSKPTLSTGAASVLH